MKWCNSYGMVLLSLFLFAGCAREVVPQRDVSVHLAPAIRDSVDNVRVTAERYIRGALQQVTLNGIGTQARRKIHWSVRWFDESGRRLEGTADRWRRATINPDAPFQFEAHAPTKDAGRAELYIRPYP